MNCNFFIPVNEDSCPSFMEDVRFLNTEITQNERQIQSLYFMEQISMYGVGMEYQQNLYQLSAHDPIFGEHTTKSFGDPANVIMYPVYNNDATVLNQWGLETDGDITVFIHISSFWNAFGVDSEPQMGDLIRMTEYGGTNRPNGRGAAIFEITRRDDEDLQNLNPLMGHYVWLIRGKRYDYSSENNVTPENLINQVHDDVPQSEGLSGVPALSNVSDNVDKTYGPSADELGIEIFNYDTDIYTNDNKYGDY
jgi:hypothetical protein